MDMGLISLLGILIGLFILIYFSLKGVPQLILGIVASIVVLLFSGVDIVHGMKTLYTPAFAKFIQSNFLIFLPACIFGALMGDSGAAEDIGAPIVKVTSRSGKNAKFWTVMALTMITAILSYGGVSGVVVLFATLPVGLALCKKMDIPWHLFMLVGTFGGSMFTAILPGSPSLQNLIPIEYLKTDAMAGPMIGIICAFIMFVLGVWYTWVEVKKSENRQEGFMETGAAMAEDLKDADASLERKAGSFIKAMLPIVVIMLALNVFKMDSMVALTLGASACIVLYYKKYTNLWKTVGTGSKNATSSIIAICAVVGFGGVVGKVPGYEFVISGLNGIPGTPLFQLALATNLVAAITGSASGGEGIALQTFAPRFLDMGINPQIIHRVVNISCYGMDSLPHNGSIVTSFQYMKLTYEQAYRHVFIISALIPFLISFLAAYLGSIGLV